MFGMKTWGVEQMREAIAADVTIDAAVLTKVDALLEDGSDLALEEAERICCEILEARANSGLCNASKYTPLAQAMIDTAMSELGIDASSRPYPIKAVSEKIAGTVGGGEDFILGLFVGKLLAEAEFKAFQEEAMAQANVMLGGGLGGMLESFGLKLPGRK